MIQPETHIAAESALPCDCNDPKKLRNGRAAVDPRVHPPSPIASVLRGRKLRLG